MRAVTESVGEEWIESQQRCLCAPFAYMCMMSTSHLSQASATNNEQSTDANNMMEIETDYNQYRHNVINQRIDSIIIYILSLVPTNNW